MITYAEACKAQSQLEEKYFDDPNITSMSVIEERDSQGNKTGEFAVEIGFKHASAQAYSKIPNEVTVTSTNGSLTTKKVHIHAVKTGQIQAFSKIPIALPDTPNDDLPPDDPLVRMHSRPSFCGQSVGHWRVTAGSIGILLEYKDGPLAKKAFLLSNNHVLAESNAGDVGDAIVQPGKMDQPSDDTSNDKTCSKYTIGHLHRYVPLLNEEFNEVDAAIAKIRGGSSDWNKYVSPIVHGIGEPIDQIVEAEIDMLVEKTGRTTGHTSGTILSTNSTLKVYYGEEIGELRFRKQIKTTRMSSPGDSGSCLFEKKSKKIVGLLFAGDESTTYYNPIGSVLSALSKPYAFTNRTGQTIRFNNDYPLTILKRTFTNAAGVRSLAARGLSLPSRFSLFAGIGAFSVCAASHLFRTKLKTQVVT